ncbi:Uncharacterised protein [Mycobacteroides abscessus subsp. massiliense]|nr:Uncharacterised protein [Mycobacteroides abscessus subsp. massiliense]
MERLTELYRIHDDANLREQAAKDGQRLADNTALRNAGRTLETVGKVARPVGVVGGIAGSGLASKGVSFVKGLFS